MANKVKPPTKLQVLESKINILQSAYYDLKREMKDLKYNRLKEISAGEKIHVKYGLSTHKCTVIVNNTCDRYMVVRFGFWTALCGQVRTFHYRDYNLDSVR